MILHNANTMSSMWYHTQSTSASIPIERCFQKEALTHILHQICFTSRYNKDTLDIIPLHFKLPRASIIKDLNRDADIQRGMSHQKNVHSYLISWLIFLQRLPKFSFSLTETINFSRLVGKLQKYLCCFFSSKCWLTSPLGEFHKFARTSVAKFTLVAV